MVCGKGRCDKMPRVTNKTEMCREDLLALMAAIIYSNGAWSEANAVVAAKKLLGEVKRG